MTQQNDACTFVPTTQPQRLTVTTRQEYVSLSAIKVHSTLLITLWEGVLYDAPVDTLQISTVGYACHVAQ
jgi:hypothetical protein